MSRLRAAPFVFAALAVADSDLCVATPAMAQWHEVPPPSPYSTGYEIRSEEFTKERVALAAEARESVSIADANIDALGDMAGSAGEREKKKEYTNLADELSLLKGHVMADIDKMGSASVNDWDDLHPIVQRDLAALDLQLKHASTITHIPAPAHQTR